MQLGIVASQFGGPGMTPDSYDVVMIRIAEAMGGDTVSMIRWKRLQDERAILRIVKQELVPISSRPRLGGARLRKELAARMRRGFTLVGSQTPDGAPVAFVHMEVRQATLFIDLLAVEAKAQKQGWGTVLMAAAESWGRSCGCVEARLFVDEKNVNGLRFYRKRGYHQVRHISEAHCIEMAKTLSGAP